jgi:hypothetical protein
VAGDQEDMGDQEKMKRKDAILVAAVLIGLFRPVLLFVDFNTHVEAAYEAVAHILVGLLLGLWLYSRDVQTWAAALELRPWVMPTFWTLAAVEVICAGIGIAMKRGLL